MSEIAEIGGHRFIGFPGNELRKATFFQTASGSPGIEEHSNLFCFPNISALYQSDGSLVPSSRLHHFDDTMAPAVLVENASQKLARYYPSAQEIPKEYAIEDRPVVLMGSTMQHWGHFLFDGLARMWAILSGDVDPQKDNLLFMNRGPQHAFADQMLAVLGIKTEQMVIPSSVTLFRNVKIVLPSVNYRFRIFQDYADVHRTVATRLRSARDFSRPAFISRVGIQNGIHNFLGEDILEQHFVARGCEVIRPETLSVADQVALFSTCPVVIGSIGSAFHSILFEPTDSEFLRVMFSPENLGGRFPMVDAVTSGHQSWYLNVMPKITGRNQPATIDAERALAYLGQLAI